MTARTPLRPGDPLPEGWRWVRLGDVAQHKTGVWGPEASSPTQGFPIVRSTEIGGLSIKPKNASVRTVKVKRIENYRLQTGDILINKSSGSPRLVGWPAIFQDPQDGRTYLFSNFMLRLRSDRTKMEPWYLLYYLHSPVARSIYLSAQATTSGLRNLRVRDFLGQLLPLPPLETQRRIVAWLDEAFSHLEAIKERHAEAEREAAALIPAKLAEVFGRAEKEGWRWVKLGEVVEQRRQQVKPSDLDGPLNYIGLEHIEPHTGRLASFEPTKAGKLKSTKAVFKKGDLLYGKLRPYLNKVWLAEFDGISSTDIIALVPMADKAMGRFLGYILRSSPILSEIKDRMTGTRMPRIRPQQLLDIGLPLPPFETQGRIVEEIEAFEEEARRIQKAQEESRAVLEQLEKSLLAEAFRPERWA